MRRGGATRSGAKPNSWRFDRHTKPKELGKVQPLSLSSAVSPAHTTIPPYLLAPYPAARHHHHLACSSSKPELAQRRTRVVHRSIPSHGGGGGAAAVAVDAGGGGGADTVDCGGGGVVSGGGAGAGGRDRLGVPELAAEHVGLPAVRAAGEHGAAAGQAVLPGAGRAGGLQPALPLRAPLRRRRLLRHRRRLLPRPRPPRHLQGRHPARLHLHCARVQCPSGPICSARRRISLRRGPTVPWHFAVRLAADDHQPRRQPPRRRRLRCPRRRRRLDAVLE